MHAVGVDNGLDDEDGVRSDGRNSYKRVRRSVGNMLHITQIW